MSAEGMYLSDEYTDKAEKGKLLQGKTSGSTGKITDFFWDEKEEKKFSSPLSGFRRIGFLLKRKLFGNKNIGKILKDKQVD